MMEYYHIRDWISRNFAPAALDVEWEGDTVARVCDGVQERRIEYRNGNIYMDGVLMPHDTALKKFNLSDFDE